MGDLRMDGWPFRFSLSPNFRYILSLYQNFLYPSLDVEKTQHCAHQKYVATERALGLGC